MHNPLNAYITGDTKSGDFPSTSGVYDETHNGLSDAFLSKLSWDGSNLSLSYSTFWGGTNREYGRAVAVDDMGHAYVSGYGSLAGLTFETSIGAPSGYDAYVLKFSTDAKRLDYSTLLAGTSSDIGYDLAVDHDGYATVAGSTNSPQLAGSNANQRGSDIFVVRLQPEGDAVAFSVLLGGSGYESSYGIDVDGAGNIYVTGSTSSADDFPVTNNAEQSEFAGSYDAFVLQLSAEEGQVQYGSYLGGSSWELGYGIAVSDVGHMYLSGYTYSENDFRQKNNSYSFGGGADAYFTLISAAVTKYYHAGSDLVAFNRSGYGQNYGRRYVFRDHFGSTSLVINGGGKVLWVERSFDFAQDMLQTLRRLPLHLEQMGGW